MLEKMKDILKVNDLCVLATFSEGKPHCSLMSYIFHAEEKVPKSHLCMLLFPFGMVYYGRWDFRSRSSTVFTGLKVSRGTSTKTVFQNAIDPFHSPGSSSALSSPSS